MEKTPRPAAAPRRRVGTFRSRDRVSRSRHHGLSTSRHLPAFHYHRDFFSISSTTIVLYGFRVLNSAMESIYG